MENDGGHDDGRDRSGQACRKAPRCQKQTCRKHKAVADPIAAGISGGSMAREPFHACNPFVPCSTAMCHCATAASAASGRSVTIANFPA
jgi:hypothetical protein